MNNGQTPQTAQIETDQNKQKRLSEYLTFFAYAMPAFGSLLSVGYLLLFLMGRLSYEGSASYSLLLTAFGTLVAVVLAMPTRKMLQRGQTSQAITMYAVGFGVFFLFLNVAWQGFLIMSVVGVWLPILMLYGFLESRQQARNLVGISFLFSILIVLTGRFRLVQPEAIDSPATLPAILLTVFVVLAFVSLAIITYAIKFSTLAARLTTTFVAIILLPALATTLVLSLQSYAHDQQMILNNMGLIAAQKIERLDQVVSAIERDRDTAIRDPRVQAFILGMLTSQPGSLYYRNSLNGVQVYFPARIKENGLYQDAILIDPNGTVVYTTNPRLNAHTFKDTDFFRNALKNPYNTTITDDPAFGKSIFIAASPIRSGSKTIGELALIADYSQFTKITEAQSGTTTGGETYLISSDLRPLTKIEGHAQLIDTEGAASAINGQTSGTGVYRNYAGTTVLGSYHWIPSLGAALISEQPQLQSLSGTFLLIGNVLLIGLFAIILSVLAVVFTSKTLTAPIHDLAEAAENVSKGNLSVHADITRSDELGKLAESFNFMAGSLKEIVNNLEVRIEERTRDLKRQAIRLRAAAEVARDSAGAIGLRELLSRSAELIGERFDFYHVGIYLMESNHDYLVLSAATGEAGKLMLQTGHKLGTGIGMVGRAAQTGETLISSDPIQIASGIHNSILPGTKTELSLPLRANNESIGVLDIHSDQANAFRDEDVAALQLMADQLSGAIERTRVNQESEDNLRELERSYHKFTREGWQTLIHARGEGILGYTYEGIDFQRLSDIPSAAREAIRCGEQICFPERDDNSGAMILAVPVRLRGTTVGAVSMKIRGQKLPADTTELANEISERLAQALEASLLLEETSARAERERIVADITNKIRATNDPQTMLATAMQELKSVLNASKVHVSSSVATAQNES